MSADLELQHTFPGCYSVMHDIKQRQARAEHVLDQAERVIDTLVPDATTRAHLHTQLDTAWDDLLFTQFHDILAGAAIGTAYESVRAMQGRALIRGEELIYGATRRWARESLPPVNEQQIVVLNPDEEAWTGLIEAEPTTDLDSWGERWLSDQEGNPIPFQRVQPESHLMIHRIIFPLTVPAKQAGLVLLRNDALHPPAAFSSDLDVSERHLRNKRLRVDVSQRGIEQVWVDGHPLLGDAGIRLLLRADGTDTWVMNTDAFTQPVLDTFSGVREQWAVDEMGPLRARIRLDGWLGHSPPHAWRDGLALGAVERRLDPQGRPVEWPLQRWSKMTLADGYELALVTNDAFSLSLSADNHWQWTLLRSPRAASVSDGWGRDVFLPGHDRYTDQGEHHFAFQLQAGSTRLSDSALDRAARQMAQPPIVFDRYEGLNRPPWGAVPPPHLRRPLETNFGE